VKKDCGYLWVGYNCFSAGRGEKIYDLRLPIFDFKGNGKNNNFIRQEKKIFIRWERRRENKEFFE
jgi:hypothetical protein